MNKQVGDINICSYRYGIFIRKYDKDVFIPIDDVDTITKTLVGMCKAERCNSCIWQDSNTNCFWRCKDSKGVYCSLEEKERSTIFRKIKYAYKNFLFILPG